MDPIANIKVSESKVLVVKLGCVIPFVMWYIKRLSAHRLCWDQFAKSCYDK